MQRVLGIDFAERASGAILLDIRGEVAKEWVLDLGPRDLSSEGITDKVFQLGRWVENVARFSALTGPTPKVLIEDVYPFAVNIKPVLRLQGALFARFVGIGWTVDIQEPKRWQPHFGYRKKEHGDSKKWAAQACEQLGYVPDPKRWTTVKKRSDLCDAYLIARYAQEVTYS